MKNTYSKLLAVGIACVAVYTTSFALPPGGRPGPAPRPSPANHHPPKVAPKPHYAPPAARPPAPGPRMAPASGPRLIPPARPPFAPPRVRIPPRHIPPPMPPHHRHAGRLFPHGHHIGGHHIMIVPPRFAVMSYYWTEEVLINGAFYLLYCYPDGTKRFSDGTIFCYF